MTVANQSDVSTDSTIQSRRYAWLSTTRYEHPLNPTQAEKWRRLIEGLEIEAYVLGFGTSIRPRRFSQSANFRLLPNLPSAILRYGVFYLFAPIILLWWVLRHRVSVVIAQSPYEGAVGAWIKVVSRLFGRRIHLIIESHGDFEKSLFLQRSVRFAGLYRGVMRHFARFATRQADAFRAVSSTTQAQIEAYAPQTPVFRFMTWTNFQVFAEMQRHCLPSESKSILYVGVLTPLKNVHSLITSFAELNDAESRLVLMGEAIDANYFTQLQSQVNELSLGECVEFTGAVQQGQLAETMASARVLVLPSLTEGLPRVLIEAMLMGLPVIASAVGGIPDIVQDGENGYLIPAGDVDALTTALQTMMQQADVDTMGQQAQTFADSFFSAEAYIDGHRRMFQHLAESL